MLVNCQCPSLDLFTSKLYTPQTWACVKLEKDISILPSFIYYASELSMCPLTSHPPVFVLIVVSHLQLSLPTTALLGVQLCIACYWTFSPPFPSLCHCAQLFGTYITWPIQAFGSCWLMHSIDTLYINALFVCSFWLTFYLVYTPCQAVLCYCTVLLS